MGQVHDSFTRKWEYAKPKTPSPRSVSTTALQQEMVRRVRDNFTSKWEHAKPKTPSPHSVSTTTRQQEMVGYGGIGRKSVVGLSQHRTGEKDVTLKM